jgi:selenocysteine-specific elongation factor
MRSIIVGTAGHIDHGKSSLVKALTGKDPDRLPEEKKRGITIDLGFADCDLGDLRVGFVDVPGHERFVKNMLAGVHGIDMVALVVAADESVMPQTREHFEICRLLDVRQGLVVVTKSDLVEDEMLPLVADEIKELVSGSFLEGKPVIYSSTRTGEGLDEFRSALKRVAAEVPGRPTQYIARLPIDRAFTIKGFGVVVTGTLVSGEISDGDDLELLPEGRRVRARGVQVHGSSVGTAVSGQRTAVNLAGVEVADVERGQVLATPGRLRPTQVLDVDLTLLPAAPRPLRTRSRVRVHIGSAEVLGRVRVLNTLNAISPGAASFVQLRLEEPVIALHGERFIVRSYSPAETIAGGVVVDPFPPRHRVKDFPTITEYLRVLTTSPVVNRLAAFVEASGEAGLRLSDVAARFGWHDDFLSHVVAEAKQEGNVISAEDVLIGSQTIKSLSQLAVDEVKGHHRRDPLARGLPRETLRERVFARSPWEVFKHVMAGLENAGLLVSEKDLVRAAEHARTLSSSDEQLSQKLAAIFEQAGLEAPSMDQAFQAAGVSASQREHARKILQVLLDDGTLVRVHGDMYFARTALDRLIEMLRKYASEQGPDRLIDVGKFKDLAGISRKYAIPLLEYFDRERVTRRAGDKRIIL